MAKWFSQALVAALCVYGALILFCLIRALRHELKHLARGDDASLLPVSEIERLVRA